jgi:hypothetical protein
MKAGKKVPNKSKKLYRDDVPTVLQHAGMLSPCLSRFEEASSQMWELEWKLMRRAAADAQLSNPGLRNPGGD